MRSFEALGYILLLISPLVAEAGTELLGTQEFGGFESAEPKPPPTPPQPQTAPIAEEAKLGTPVKSPAELRADKIAREKEIERILAEGRERRFAKESAERAGIFSKQKMELAARNPSPSPRLNQEGSLNNPGKGVNSGEGAEFGEGKGMQPEPAKKGPGKQILFLRRTT